VKKLIPIAVIAALVAGCEQAEQKQSAAVEATQSASNDTTQAAEEFANDVQKRSYALGAIYSSRVIEDTNKMDSIDIDAQAFKQGFLDGLEGKSRLDQDQLMQQMMAYQQELRAAAQAHQKQLVEQNKTDGAAFIAKLKAEDPSIKSTASGLHYKVLEEGDGQTHPTADDVVAAHYAGSLIDGTEFDNSRNYGDDPVPFPLNRVIPGWTEGLQLMTKGAKYRFFIPSDIAYGDQGNGPIPGGATLIFDVELVDINPEPKQANQAKGEQQ
jgi:FKBP-type peptidyl-prolyl cis-trans isomerase